MRPSRLEIEGFTSFRERAVISGAHLEFLTVLDDESADAVHLQFKEPVGVIEGLGGKSGEHRLDVPGHWRLPGRLHAETL